MIKAVNQAACTLLGYGRGELEGRPFAELFADAADSPLLSASLLTTLKEKGTVKSLERSFRAKTGEIIPVLLSLSMVADDTNFSDIVCLAQDDTERRRTQEELLKMVRAVEQSPSAVLITDIQGRIEYVNPKFCQLTGYSPEDLIGRNPNILQSGNTAPELYHSLWRAILSGEEWRGEIKNRKKNGEFYWARECISPIRNAGGEITHFIAIEEDFTLSKQVETALQESEERFRRMAEMTGEWLWEQNPDGYYSYSSAAVESILGYRPDEVVGRHYTKLFTPEYRESLLNQAVVQKPFFSLVNRYSHKEGHTVYTESTGVPIHDVEGRLVKWQGVDRDITVRERFEEALMASEKRTRMIVENAMDAIVIMDQNGLITDWNPKAETLFGWPAQEAIGRRMDETILPQRFRRDHRKALEHFLQTGEAALLKRLTEQTATRRDGCEFPVELSISPLRLGKSYVFSCFIRDITERKQAEKEIRQTQVKLAVAHREMKIARQIQESLFPSEPLLLTNLQVMGYCLPAAQVGGDYFDYFRRESDSVDVVIADVSGHSVGPALFMAETRSALRSQSRSSGGPSETLALMNETLYEDLYHTDHFITMFYMQYDSANRELRYANAGHPPPLLWRRSQTSCTRLDSEGLVLGVRKKVKFEENRLHLDPGDLILLYTDGVTEAESPEGEFFGAERLCQILNRNADLPSSGLIRCIIDDLKEFCRAKTFDDDITLVIFKIG